MSWISSNRVESISNLLSPTSSSWYGKSISAKLAMSSCKVSVNPAYSSPLIISLMLFRISSVMCGTIFWNCTEALSGFIHQFKYIPIVSVTKSSHFVNFVLVLRPIFSIFARRESSIMIVLSSALILATLIWCIYRDLINVHYTYCYTYYVVKSRGSTYQLTM